MLIHIQNMLHYNGFLLQLLVREKQKNKRLADKASRVILATKERGLYLPYLVAKTVILHNFSDVPPYVLHTKLKILFNVISKPHYNSIIKTNF